MRCTVITTMACTVNAINGGNFWIRCHASTSAATSTWGLASPLCSPRFCDCSAVLSVRRVPELADFADFARFGPLWQIPGSPEPTEKVPARAQAQAQAQAQLLHATTTPTADAPSSSPINNATIHEDSMSSLPSCLSVTHAKSPLLLPYPGHWTPSQGPGSSRFLLAWVAARLELTCLSTPAS